MGKSRWGRGSPARKPNEPRAAEAVAARRISRPVERRSSCLTALVYCRRMADAMRELSDRLFERSGGGGGV